MNSHIEVFLFHATFYLVGALCFALGVLYGFIVKDAWDAWLIVKTSQFFRKVFKP